MTILEAKYQFGSAYYRTTYGDTITTIVSKVYQDYADLYYRILQVLNNRYDWYELVPGTLIEFIPKDYCSQISELM